MALLDKLSKAAKNAATGASTLAKNAADSTGEMIAVQKLKMKINEEEKAIVDLKSFIGELTWQQFDGQGDKSVEIAEQCALIRDSLNTIAGLEQQIDEIKAEKEAIRSERKAAAAEAVAGTAAAAAAAAEEAVAEEAPAEEAPAEEAPAEEAPAAEAEIVSDEAPAADGHCPQCGAQVSAGARFCGVCGARQDQ